MFKPPTDTGGKFFTVIRSIAKQSLRKGGQGENSFPPRFVRILCFKIILLILFYMSFYMFFITFFSPSFQEGEIKRGNFFIFDPTNIYNYV